MPEEESSQLVVYTVGHSNVALEAFLALLARHEIAVLADVRSAPYSRYVPHFNRSSLEAAAKRAGITYRFMGDALAARIRCRWKGDEAKEGGPGPYTPDINDGVKVHMRPFQELGLLATSVIKKWE